MKLNDPFGRLEKRNQTNYAMMRDAMAKSGINTVQGAQKIIKRSKDRSLKFLSVVIVILLLIGCFAPQAVPVIGAIAVLVIVWTINSMINGEKYVKRYIKEEIKGSNQNRDQT